MTKTNQRITAFLLAMTVVFTMFITLAAPEAQAAGYPTGYPNTYKNTGNGAIDIVGVARTQVGYKENSYGTKYGHWYNGIFDRQPWCAMFVSWCANQAKISNDVIQKYASCSAEVAWFKSIGRWHDSKYYGGNYTPQRGDIVFYRDSGSNSVSTHTGVLAGLNGNYLDVIEGNATNASACEFTTNASRTLSSSYVIGYGNPNYSQEIEEEPDDCEKWQVSTDALSFRKEASTSSSRITTVPFAKVLNVTEFKQAGGYLWGYTKYSKKTGWVALDFCDYICGSLEGVYYQLPPTVTPKSKSLYVGGTKKLTMTNGLGATYTSTDKTVAKVSKKGKITALKSGTATIKCKTQTGSATCKVTVLNPVLSAKTAETCVGDKITLEVTGGTGDITWTSSDKKIAKVSKAGKVTGVSEGKATITAERNGVQLECAVTVTQFPTTYENFTVTEKTPLYDGFESSTKLKNIPVGAALKVTEVKYTNTFTWGQTTYKSLTGWVVLNHCGYENGTIGGKAYKVKAYLETKSKKMYITKTYALKVNSSQGELSYKSADEEVATVDAKGVIHAHKAGKTKITVSDGETKMKFTVTVLNPYLDTELVRMLKGETAAVKVKGGSGDIIWKSEDETNATVENGLITGVDYGKVIVTAERNGILMKCVVKVYDPYISAEKASLKVGATKTLKVKKAGGDAVVEWSSSKKSVAAVSNAGVVTAKKAGTAVITAKTRGVTMTCTVTVK